MLKVLLIGGGRIAGGFDSSRPAAPPLTHAGAYSGHGGFELSAVVDPDLQQQRAFMQQWGIPRGFASMAAVIGSGQRFDVVSICSPTHAHHADAIAALKLHPRLIFCEKPICSALVGAQDIVERCRIQGIPLAVNYSRRWDPAVKRLCGDIEARRWGQLRSVSGLYNKGVLNNGSHMFDLLHALLGPVSLVHAGPPNHDFWPDDPSIPVQLATQGGCPVMINCSNGGDFSLFELQLVFERAVVAMEDGGLAWRIRKAGSSPHFAGYRSLSAGEQVTGEYFQTMSMAVANIHECLGVKTPLASTGDTALAAHRLCDEIRVLAAACT